MSPALHSHPVVKTTYSKNGTHIIREYVHKIDFVPAHLNATIRGYVMLAIPNDYASSLISMLNHHKMFDYFHVVFRPMPDTLNKIKWIMFKIKRFTTGNIKIESGQALAALRVLLSQIDNTENVKIIWKEDEHGYEIDQHGNIKRKWTLQPF